MVSNKTYQALIDKHREELRRQEQDFNNRLLKDQNRVKITRTLSKLEHLLCKAYINQYNQSEIGNLIGEALLEVHKYMGRRTNFQALDFEVKCPGCCRRR